MAQLRNKLVPAYKIFARRQNGYIPNISLKATITTGREARYDKVKGKNEPKGELLRQPVPKLENTLAKLVKSLEPLVTDAEMKNTKKAIEEFKCVGEKLQDILHERAKCHENWLLEWWVNTAYLGFRSSVVIQSSPGLVFPQQKFNSIEDQLEYTAHTIFAALEYKKKIDTKQIPAEFMGKQPLDMSQFTKIFGTCRIPGEKLDTMSYDDPKDPAKHIVVCHNNHFFKVNVLNDCGDSLPVPQLIALLEQVVKMSPEKGPPIGILSTDGRDAWYKAFTLLSCDECNVASLCAIRRSLFLSCIDGANPMQGLMNDQTATGHHLIHGCGSQASSGNRWFDKTVQFITSCNGGVGLAYEHTPAEGPPIVNVMQHILDYFEKKGKSKSGDKCSSDGPPPEKLKFNVSKELEAAIKSAETNIDKAVCDLGLSCFTFDCYGKDFIKSMKFSPDSFIQTAIQFAFFRLHKIPGAHYESASQRLFLHGRTDTIRSCSTESTAFACEMLRKDATPVERVKALATAVQAHKTYTLATMKGDGIDRHLLGLKLAAIEAKMELPALFKDPGVVRSSSFRVSTSQVAAKHNAFMCYGVSSVDSYACCYNPRPKDIILAPANCKASAETDVKKFHEALETSLIEMHEQLLLAKPPSDKEKPKK